MKFAGKVAATEEDTLEANFTITTVERTESLVVGYATWHAKVTFRRKVNKRNRRWSKRFNFNVPSGAPLSEWESVAKGKLLEAAAKWQELRPGPDAGYEGYRLVITEWEEAA
jgi:hypothetical protein